MKLIHEVRRIAWSACTDMLKARGFRRNGRGRFTKVLADGISGSVWIGVENRALGAAVQPRLMIFHPRVAALVDEEFEVYTAAQSDPSRRSEAIETLSLSSVMRRFGYPQPPILWVPICDAAGALIVAATIVEGLELVADRYFAQAQSNKALIAYFESDRQAGGTANMIKLLSLCYVEGEFQKLHDLLARIAPDNAAPMTVRFKDYMLARLAREEAQRLSNGRAQYEGPNGRA